MTCKIAYNEHTCRSFESTEEWQRMFLRAQGVYFNDLLISRGYVYLNRIFENLEIDWDPNKDNPCCIYNPDIKNRIDFKIRKVKNGFNITITW